MSNITATTKEKPLIIYSRVKEDGVSKVFTFKNADGTPHDISGLDFEYLLKAKPGTTANIFRLSIGDGLTVQGDDSNQLVLDISEERATNGIRPLLYFGLLRSISENKTWLNVKHQFIDGNFDGVDEFEKDIIVYQNGGTVEITIGSGGTGGGSINYIDGGTASSIYYDTGNIDGGGA